VTGSNSVSGVTSRWSIVGGGELAVLERILSILVLKNSAKASGVCEVVVGSDGGFKRTLSFDRSAFGSDVEHWIERSQYSLYFSCYRTCC
jgi:hypothetical protein